MNDALGSAHGRNAEEWANAVEKDNQNDQHSAGDEPEPGDAVALGHHENEQSRTEGRKQGSDEGVRRRNHGAVSHKPRKQEHGNGHDSAKGSVSDQHPAVEANVASAIEEVTGKNGDGGNGGQDIARELGLGEGEKDDWNERPEDKKLREGVPRPADWGRSVS